MIRRNVVEKVRKEYFPGVPAEKCYVMRSDVAGHPLQKRKLLVNLDPPLTEETILLFGAEKDLVEAEEDKPPQYSEEDSSRFKTNIEIHDEEDTEDPGIQRSWARGNPV